MADFYKKLILKRVIFILIGLVLMGTLFVFDVITGPAKLSFIEVFKNIIGIEYDESINFIVFEMRIPYALMALVAGASLGLSGAVMQTALQNPLASPYTLGIGSAAAFGAAVGIVFLDGSFWGIWIFAFIFSAASLFFIYYLSKRVFLGSSTIVLIGIILVFIYQSLQAFVVYLANEIEVSNIVFWTFGSLSRASYLNVSILFATLLVILILLLAKSWSLNALLLGDEKAKSLGINTEKLKIEVLICVSLLTTICVCFVGTIGFIGLVSPHIARLLIGGEQRFYLVFSTVIGAFLLSFSSVLSKNIISGIIFPIGIITSFIGAVFFLVIILRKGLR
ncbi:iron ABC transporter permease [uncultured Campylobacter sp.]|uniref:FecCD family ABC transporter permease n=1 Tax=uncultured Campylobacter sp. TaxID=218934 RepID=UPI002631FF55|nr:iron ABC transporter permease [uncultured Campylobacter sp.]